MEGLKRYGRRFSLGYKALLAAYSMKGYLIYKIINPFFMMTFFCLVASYVYGRDQVAPYVIGNALLMCYFSVFFGISQIFTTERMQGTLETVICSPTGAMHTLLPKVLMFITDSLVSVFVSFVTGFLLFGFRLTIEQLAWFVLITLISIVSALGFGLLIGVFALLTRDLFLLLNIFSMVLVAFSGANFDVALIPWNLGIISQFLPLTRGINALRLLHQGGSFEEVIGLASSELVIGIVYFLLGVLLYRFVERMALRHGTVSMH